MISNSMMIYDDADLLEYMIYWFHHWMFVCCLGMLHGATNAFPTHDGFEPEILVQIFSKSFKENFSLRVRKRLPAREEDQH